MAALVYLKCMLSCGGSSPPGVTIQHTIANGEDVTYTRVIYKQDGSLDFRLTDVRNIYDHDQGDLLLAQISYYSNLSLVLEPLVEKVYIELPIGSGFARRYNPDRIVVPRSKGHEHHYVHLRDDDVVNFEGQGLKLRVVIEMPSVSATLPDDVIQENGALPQALPFPSATSRDDVQVKSSNAEEIDGGEVTDSDEEEDLDEFKSVATPVTEITPATSRPAVAAIKETPNAKTLEAPSLANTDAGDNEPFSTAQDELTNDAQRTLQDEPPPDSPSVRAKVSITSRASQVVRRKEVPGTSDYGSELDDEESPQKREVDGTDDENHSAELSPRQPSEDRAKIFLATMDGTADEQVYLVDADEEGQDDDDDGEQLNMGTSDPLQPVEVFVQTAERSQKRKLEAELFDDAEEDDDGDEVIVATKKRKIAPTDDTPKKSDEAAEDEKPATRSTRGKLSRPSRQFTVNSSPVEPNEPQSRGKKRPISPQVVVSPTSETPTSTATSAILSGKAPKVLLSHESKLRKSLGKWFKEHGVEIIDDVKTRRTNFVCVVKDDNIKTAKVLRSLALGKLVVTEDWLQDSKTRGQLLDPQDYVHEKIGIPAKDRRKLFYGKNLFFTTTLAEKVYGPRWQDIVDLCTEAGASDVRKGSSKDFGQMIGSNETLCFGTKPTNDADVGRLQSQFSCTVFNKDLITHAMISGELDLEDEEYVLP
ncbi:uncharacterized protein LTR77_004803 [Saxophila tyrrhenica]|uniref:BRCT domain-containing protein n=1 Tax=Saxophila tyrrhenica TaxID=1690608 RepID=A0AAV9PA38_9PEZI|nr:hypothetical protein LTR77_004803 [Saxophila tyrrhenica]